MKWLFPKATVFCCLLLTLSCEKAQKHMDDLTDESTMRARITELNKLVADESLDQEVRNRQRDSINRILSIDYPASPPVSKDSVARLIKAKLPLSIDGMVLETKAINHNKPGMSANLVEILHTAKYQNQDYFSASVSYGKKGEGVTSAKMATIIIQDYGHIPEWVFVYNLDKAFRGEENRLLLIGDLYNFEKIVTHNRHVWAIYLPRSAVRYGDTNIKNQDVSAYCTQWNNRFVITLICTENSETVFNIFDKLVDVDWLDQLKRPNSARQ